jgi:hypothetical protein
MRDIRSDLHERANSADEEIRAFYAECEKMIEQLQKERDAKVAKAKAKLEIISKLIEFESEDVGKVQSAMPPAALPPLSSENNRASPTPLARAIGFKKVG